ncbi:MAG: GntR family transcriptional regulator [Lachnospiraceae bacterium]|nr:GntR family transcriptional regulator [Lachnospiraceae bacterium]
MDIIITNSSDKPIYEQIEDQIKAQIMSGNLKEGDALPSMRLLAKELRISIITTKRAYEDLERDGYIESYTGKGSFVKGVNREMVKESVMFEIETLMEEMLDKAKIAKVSFDELMERMKLLYEEKESQDDE